MNLGGCTYCFTQREGHPLPGPRCHSKDTVRPVRDPCVPSGRRGAPCVVLQARRTAQSLPLHYLEVPHQETESSDSPSWERCMKVDVPPAPTPRQQGKWRG